MDPLPAVFCRKGWWCVYSPDAEHLPERRGIHAGAFFFRYVACYHAFGRRNAFVGAFFHLHDHYVRGLADRQAERYKEKVNRLLAPDGSLMVEVSSLDCH